MRIWVGVAVLAFVLAGCSGSSQSGSGDGADDRSVPVVVDEGTTTTHAGNNASPGGTSGPGPSGSANHAPTGSMAPSAVAGTAPLQVNFTLDGTDKDGDALSWTLDANGDGKLDGQGKTLPFVATFTYTTGGKFNVTYKITDQKSDVVYHVAIDVAANLPTGAQSPISISGTISGAYIGLPVGVGLGYTGTNAHDFDVTSVAKQLTGHLEWGSSGVDLDFYVYAPDGTEAGYANSYNEPTGTAFNAGEPDIVVTDPTLLEQVGTWKVIVAPGEAVQATYTVTITFSNEAPAE